MVCGALFRPLQWELEDDSDSESESSSSDDSEESSSSESDSETSYLKRYHSNLLHLPVNSPGKSAPIASTECFKRSEHELQLPKILFNDGYRTKTTSTTNMHQDRPRLTKNFSSDFCLEYNDLVIFNY